MLSSESWSRFWHCVRKRAPPLNFLTFHLMYFVGTCALGALLLWGSATPQQSLSFTDSVFLAVSAMTEAGLNTVNLSQLNTFQQVVLFLLIMSGSGVLVSAVVVQVRKAAFEKKFKAIVLAAEREQDPIRSLSSGPEMERTAGSGDKVTARDHLPPYPATSTPSNTGDDIVHWGYASTPHWLHILSGARSASRSPAPGSHKAASPDSEPVEVTGSTPLPRAPLPSYQTGSPQCFGPEFGLPLAPSLHAAVQLSLEKSRTANAEVRDVMRRRASSLIVWIAGGSRCGLNGRERQRLGGSEYRAICLLAWVVPLYYVLFQLLGALGCAAWIVHHRPDVALQNGLNPWWVGAFKAVSAFNNSGMDLLDMNMQPFQDAYYLLMTMSLLILAGNTCYPIFLRLIIWLMLKLSEPFEHGSEERAERVDTLRFLLKHPRRCYTLLFPSSHTWWLLTSVVVLNGIDWAAFGILSIDNPVFAGISAGNRTIDGLFQAFAIRSGGFYIISVSSLHIALQLLYVFMMYISVYPLLATVRTSNVYRERTLAIYGGGDKPWEDHLTGDRKSSTAGDGDDERHEYRSPFARLLRRGRTSNTAARLRGQLAHDAWLMAIALFCILLIEERQFNRDPTVFSVFNFIFEIVSGYGTVGVSTGVPWNNYSFCGAWHKGSKLILCAVMLRGRHRGLPVAIDKAVLLPGEHDDEDANDEELAHVSWNTNRERHDSPMETDRCIKSLA